MRAEPSRTMGSEEEPLPEGPYATLSLALLMLPSPSPGDLGLSA